MVEPTIEEKEKYLDDLGKFVDDAENRLKDLCSSIGWDYDSLHKYEDTEKYAICPFNDGHRVPERTMHKHLIKCEWKALGYTQECKPLPEAILPPEDPSTIKFDMQLQTKVLREAKEKNPELNISLDEKFIPQTSDRLTSDFSCDEKKAIYEYVVANTVGPDIGYDITEMNKPGKLNDNNEQSTPIEMLLAQERNLKRRRAKHRGVHTNKKSHIEIMRELVHHQMEMYREHLSDKYGIPIPNDDENTKHNNQELVQDEKNYEDSFDESTEQSSYSKQDRRNWDYDDHENKYTSKGSDLMSERERHNKKDYGSSRKHSNHETDYDYNNTTKRDSGNSSRRHHQYYDSTDKYKSEHERNRDKYDYRGKHRDTYESGSKDKYRYDSHDRDKYDSRYFESQDPNKYKLNRHRDPSKDNKYDYHDQRKDTYVSRNKSKDEYNSLNTKEDKSSKFDLDQSTRYKNNVTDESLDKKESKPTAHIPRSRKRGKSTSSERDFAEEPECDPKVKNSHKKHKKERKRAKDKSRDKESDKKHKKSKRKRDRDRSRS